MSVFNVELLDRLCVGPLPDETDLSAAEGLGAPNRCSPAGGWDTQSALRRDDQASPIRALAVLASLARWRCATPDSDLPRQRPGTCRADGSDAQAARLLGGLFKKSGAEALVDRGDVDGGLVADGELVVAGGDGAVAFEPVDAAFDGVALLVAFRVERGRTAATARCSCGCGSGRPARGWWRRSPAAAGRRGWPPIRRPCRPGPGRAGAGAGPAQPGHGDAVSTAGTAGCRRAAGGDHDRQRFLPLLTRQVDLGGQPAAGPAQPMVGRSRRRVAPPADPLCAPRPRADGRATTVESTLTSQVISPAASARACNRVRMRAQVPSRCQRRNNP